MYNISEYNEHSFSRNKSGLFLENPNHGSVFSLYGLNLVTELNKNKIKINITMNFEKCFKKEVKPDFETDFETCFKISLKILFFCYLNKLLLTF